MFFLPAKAILRATIRPGHRALVEVIVLSRWSARYSAEWLTRRALRRIAMQSGYSRIVAALGLKRPSNVLQDSKHAES